MPVGVNVNVNVVSPLTQCELEQEQFWTVGCITNTPTKPYI